MKNHEPSAEDDIVNQPYKGPSITSAVAGEGFIAHFTLGALGLLAGGLIGYFAPKQVGKVEEAFSKFSENWVTSKNWLIKGPAGLARLLEKGSKSLTDHLPGREKIEAFADVRSKMQTVVFGGGLLGSLGYFVFPLLMGPKGAKKGIEGRRQFEQAKAEIVNLRSKLVEKQTELDDTKTSRAAQEGILKVAQDEPPTIQDTDHSPASIASKFVAKPEANWADAVAQQKAAAPETALS